METTTTEASKTPLQINAQQALLDLITDIEARRKLQASKTDEQLAEDFITENKCPRPNNIPIHVQTPFTEESLQYFYLIQDSVHTLPDSEAKTHLFFLLALCSEAHLAIQSAEHTAHQWRQRADRLLVELIKETWVKQSKRQTNGAFGRSGA